MSRTGFTLVELVMTVLVVSIVAALVMPTLGNSAQSRLRGAARMVVADLAFAQSESISNNTGEDADRRVVVFDAEDDRYFVARFADPSTPIEHPFNGRDYAVHFGQGRAARLDGVTIGSDSTLIFGIYGQLESTADKTITLACRGNRISITVDADTGEATVVGN